MLCCSRSTDLYESSAGLMRVCSCRTGATLESSVIIQSALPELPQLYVPDVDSLDYMCSKVQDVENPVRFLEIVGAPGRGGLGFVPSHINTRTKLFADLA